MVGYTEQFDTGFGVHQRPVLSPLLFEIVLDVLSEGKRKGILYELLYVDDRVIMTEAMEELEAQINRWKSAFEGRWLKVNIGKQRVWSRKGASVEAKADPFGV